MANSLTRVQDSGANYQYFDKRERPDVPRSSFDLSYTNVFPVDFGVLYPIYVQDTVPGDSFQIAEEILLRGYNPPVVPLMQKMRVFTHFYFCSYAQLSKDWQTVISKGRSGKYVGSAPKIVISPAQWTKFGRGSLSDFLGLNFSDYPETINANIEPAFNAFAHMAYLRIYRDYYLNPNLPDTATADPSDWFPVDDSDFRLPAAFSGDLTSVKFSGDGANGLDLTVLRYRNWFDDYFTSSRPWPQRGEESSLAFDFSPNNNLNVGIMDNGKFNQVAQIFGQGHLSNITVGDYATAGGLTAPDANSFIASWSNTATPAFRGGTSDSYKVAGNFGIRAMQLTTPLESGSASYPLIADVSNLSGSSNITLSALRELNANQRMLEKMARLDGSYSDFVFSFFGRRPASGQSFRPIYIGGTSQDVRISEIVNTAGVQASADGSVLSQQGQQTGHAGSYESSRVGTFNCTEYGIIIGLLSLMPDTMYFQGIRRDRSAMVQEDFYLPERAGLSPQAVLNQEIYNTPDDAEQNAGLFAYQDRYDEMRFRQNEIHGAVTDPTNKMLFPYTMARYFTQLPTFSRAFVEMSATNIRKDAFTTVSDPPFICMVANKVRAVRPLPYKAKLAELFDTRG